MEQGRLLKKGMLRAMPGSILRNPIVLHLARIGLGVAYLAGGLIPFIHWAELPIPRPIVGDMLRVFVDSDLLRVSKTIEIVFGCLLLANRWVPLSVAVTAPVLFIIAWVDWYLDPFPSGVVAVSLMVCAQCILAYHCREHFMPLFASRVAA